MASKSAHGLNLSQCYRIRANWYRSACNRFDYEAEEIDARIIALEARKSARENAKALAMVSHRDALMAPIKGQDVPPPIPAECDEGLDACEDEAEERLYFENGFSYTIIPPIILAF
jgi:hypothetical protein